MVCAMTPRQWRSLCRATGIEDDIRTLEAKLGVDLSVDAERFLHRIEIDRLLEPAIASQPFADVARRFDVAQVLWSRYRTFKEVVAEEGPARERLGSPLMFSGMDHPPRTAPTIGADTEKVLVEILELDRMSLATLRADGVIG